MTKAEQKKAVQFTRMCKFWRTNECKMGTECTFAHTTEELRPSPKPCFDFVKKGICSRGQACRFVHDLNGIKPKAKIMEVPYASLDNFQPCAVPSQVLATYMLPSQSPMNVEGWLEPQYAYTQAAWPMRSEDRSSSYTPPGLDQIPLPASLVDDPELMAERSSKEESRRPSLCETSLGLGQFSVSLTKNMDPEDMFAPGSLTSTMSLSGAASYLSDFEGPYTRLFV
ncbi:zfs1 [Symbiodinium sp. CCMP2456]|nr:zfs1 [Symbiodinium sp. CCMP2456]